MHRGQSKSRPSNAENWATDEHLGQRELERLRDQQGLVEGLGLGRDLDPVAALAELLQNPTGPAPKRLDRVPPCPAETAPVRHPDPSAHSGRRRARPS